MNVHDPVLEDMKAREFDAEAQRYAKKSAAAQGSWLCPCCKSVRISANKPLCGPCVSMYVHCMKAWNLSGEDERRLWADSIRANPGRLPGRFEAMALAAYSTEPASFDAALTPRMPIALGGPTGKIGHDEEEMIMRYRDQGMEPPMGVAFVKC